MLKNYTMMKKGNMEMMHKQVKMVIDLFTSEDLPRQIVIAHMQKILAEEILASGHEQTTLGSFLSKGRADFDDIFFGTPIGTPIGTPRKKFFSKHCEERSSSAEDLNPIAAKTIDDLKDFRKTTKNLFGKMNQSGQLYEAKSASEQRIIRAHSFSSGIADRFPLKSKKYNVQEGANRILKSVQHLPEESSESEQNCLAALNNSLKKGSVKFVMNTTTFLKDGVSGTPDAVQIKNGAVVGVAEFKCVSKDSALSTYRVAESHGRLQVQLYAHLFSLNDGHLLIEQGGNIELHNVMVDLEEFRMQLKTRKSHHKDACTFIDNWTK